MCPRTLVYKTYFRAPLKEHPYTALDGTRHPDGAPLPWPEIRESGPCPERAKLSPALRPLSRCAGAL